MDTIKIIPHVDGYDPNPNLWQDETLTKTWNVNTDTFTHKLNECFNILTRCKKFKELSLCAFDNNKHIGVRLIEPLENFVNGLTIEHFDKYRTDLDLKPFIGCYEYGINIVHQWIVINNIDINTVAHFCGLAVDPNYRKIGLGTELVKQSLKHLRIHNYQYVVVETTGDYSRKIMEKYQACKLGFINYKTYCEGNDYPAIVDHEEFGVYYIKL